MKSVVSDSLQFFAIVGAYHSNKASYPGQNSFHPSSESLSNKLFGQGIWGAKRERISLILSVCLSVEERTRDEILMTPRKSRRRRRRENSSISGNRVLGLNGAVCWPLLGPTSHSFWPGERVEPSVVAKRAMSRAKKKMEIEIGWRMAGRHLSSSSSFFVLIPFPHPILCIMRGGKKEHHPHILFLKAADGRTGEKRGNQITPK